MPVSPSAAESLEARLSNLDGPSFQLQISDEEATSYVALRLGGHLPLSAPQVRFYADEVAAEGTLTSPFRAAVRLSGGVQVTGGQVELSIHQVRIGRVAIPPFLLASLSDSLSEMANDSLAANAIEVREISIGTGQMAVSGLIHKR